jgi:hypothetical protein
MGPNEDDINEQPATTAPETEVPVRTDNDGNPQPETGPRRDEDDDTIVQPDIDNDDADDDE